METGNYNVQFDKANEDYYITATQNFSDGSGGVKELYVQQTATGRTITIHTFDTDESTYDGYNGSVRMYDYEQHTIKSRDLSAEVHNILLETVTVDALSKEITELISNISQGEKPGKELYEYTDQAIRDLRRVQAEKSRSKVESTLLDREEAQQKNTIQTKNLEKEIAEAIDSGDSKQLAEKRAALNQLKMEELLKQNLLLEKQAQQAQKTEQQAQKEQGVELYKEYLTKGQLSRDQLRTLRSLDETLSDGDKISLILEAIEQVQGQSGLSLANYRKLVEAVQSDQRLTANLLGMEYEQMAIGKMQGSQQHTMVENSVDLTLE